MARRKQQTEDKDGHQLWLGAMSRGEYPTVKRDNRQFYVRRLVWEDVHGAIPEGMTVRASCGVARCVKADHLYLAPMGSWNAGRRRCRGAWVGKSSE